MRLCAGHLLALRGVHAALRGVHCGRLQARQRRRKLDWRLSWHRLHLGSNPVCGCALCAAQEPRLRPSRRPGCDRWCSHWVSHCCCRRERLTRQAGSLHGPGLRGRCGRPADFHMRDSRCRSGGGLVCDGDVIIDNNGLAGWVWAAVWLAEGHKSIALLHG